MSSLACGHSTKSPTHWICKHLLGQDDPDYHEYFIGTGTSVAYICEECAANWREVDRHLREVCSSCFEYVRMEGFCDDIVGMPELKERKTDLYFHHEFITVPGFYPRVILDMHPATHEDRNVWLAISQDQEIIQFNLDEQTVSVIAKLPESTIDFSQRVALHLSANAEMAAVVNLRGANGLVVNLRSGEVTMALERGQYYPEHSNFPVAFFERNQKLYLVHAANWNLLHISDPYTGELLTERSPDELDKDGKERFLPYFQGQLLVSPDQDYIVADGWIWHPMGSVRAWRLTPWLEENPWECDEKGSLVHLYERDGIEGGPFCWLDSRRLITWGYGESHVMNVIPAARIFDVTTGEEETWFPGPKGKLIFDDYLFAFDEEEGTGVWDINTEELLHHEFGWCPNYYHPGIRAFLTHGEEGDFRISRLLGKPINGDWLTPNNGTVRNVAQTIQDEKTFEDLPILADALEDAGCDDERILSHCRAGETHGNHCWVVDYLLYGQEFRH